MADFLAQLQAAVAFPESCEVAVLPRLLNLEAHNRGLLSPDFRNAFNTVNREVIMHTWSQIFSEALPSVPTTYLPHYTRLQQG